MNPPEQAFGGIQAEALLRALPDSVLLIRQAGDTPHDRTRTAVTLNAAARKRLGGLEQATPDGANGGAGADLDPDLDWLTLFPAEGRAAVQDAVARAWQGESLTLSLKLDGAIAPALLSAVPAGTGAALLHLRESSDPLDVAMHLMEGMSLGMVVQGQDGQIMHANQAAEGILGLSLDQLTGRDSLDPRWQSVHPDGTPFPGDQHPAMQALRSGRVQRRVPMRVFQPQQNAWSSLIVTAIPHHAPGRERPSHVTTIFADVTEQERTQRELLRSEQRFRSLVETTTQVVWTTDATGQMTVPQPGWEAFSGQTPDEYTRSGWEQAIHPEDRERVLEAWAHSLQTLCPYRVEQRVRRKDGVYVPMQTYALPLKNEDGTVREWIGMDTDISAMRAAQHELHTLNAELEQRVQLRTQELAEATRLSSLLLSAAGEGVFGVDREGRTIFANPAVADMLGYRVQELVGADKHALIHHHHADGRPYDRQDSPIYQTLQDGQPRRIDRDVLWHAAGHAIPVEYVAAPMHDEHGQVTGAVVIVQDITERLRTQTKLQQAIQNLERSNQELEQFAYVASHDLQEPLRTLGSYTELLARRYQGQLDPRADQYLNFIRLAVERMHSLIQDLLGFAKVGRGDLRPQPFVLNQVMAGAAQDLQATLQSRNGTLTWETPHRALGHPGLVTQLLVNLISNGLKFVAPGTLPEVSVRSVQAGEWIQVSVQDNGIGIAPEYQTRVFDIFQRLHHRDIYAGNGMGLAICRKIVEQHGGNLWLESALGQGSTFHFTLPAPGEPRTPDPTA